jgi:hypothetical protein
MDEQITTAYICVKANKNDPVYQDILVSSDGTYYHRQTGRWYTLPKDWEKKAEMALRREKHKEELTTEIDR